MAVQKSDFVLALDVGSTCIKSIVMNSKAEICGSASCRMQYLQPKPCRLEMDPEVIWDLVKKVLIDCVKDAGLEFKDISGLGVSAQRGCCLTWDKETGKPFHNILSWMDKRCAPIVGQWNKSLTLKAVNVGSSLLYYLSGCNKKYKLGTFLRFESSHGSMMLLALLAENKELREKVKEGKAVVGNLDSWLLWKFTSGTLHITDHSFACATAMYDPFECDWSILMKIIDIPRTIFPKVVDSCGDLATIDEKVFGVPLKVTAIISDVSAALFGLGCVETGRVTCNLGTGAFLEVTTGPHVHALLVGIYPQVAWKIGDKMTYYSESCGGALSPSVDWLKELGFVEELSELDALALSVPDSAGVCFIPAYSGLEFPSKDVTACTALFGVQRDTKKEHIIRAVFEAVAFRFYQMFDQLKRESVIPLKDVIRVAGGMSKSDVVVQSIANLFNCKVERPYETDQVGIGTAFLAGIGAGIWKSQAEISKRFAVEKTFTPHDEDRERLLKSFDIWFEATTRCRKWYSRDHGPKY